MATSKNHEYEKDFYAWTMHTAELIRQGKFNEIDVENVAEEIESMGKSDKRELISRLTILIAHLLKWQFQPDRRGNSWKYTIEEQRDELLELLEDSPSLKHELESKLNIAHKRATRLAATEICISKDLLPQECPFTLAQCLNADFLPD